MCSGRIKNTKLSIWPIFTCVNRTFDTGYPVCVSLLPLCFVRSRKSVHFLVRFPLSDERTWVARQEYSIGADGESLLTTQPSHICWDYKIYTRYLIYAFSAIQPSCLHSLNGHYPHCSIYPHQCWDYGNYSYPSLIRRKPLSAATPQFYRKFTSVDWVSGEQKNVSCKNINWQWFPWLAHACDVLWYDIVSVDQIAHGKCDCRTVIFGNYMLSLTGLRELRYRPWGIHLYTGWWVYDNITLHSLCYLARVRPVIMTIADNWQQHNLERIWWWVRNLWLRHTLTAKILPYLAFVFHI